MLTKEEKDDLRLEYAQARHRCMEIDATICQIKNILATYHKDYDRWAKRRKKADKALALEEKFTKLPGPGEKKKKQKLVVQLTKQQILAIAHELGVKLDFLNDSYDEGEEVE